MRWVSVICASVLALASDAHAQGVAEFYKGKSIEIYIGTSAAAATMPIRAPLASHGQARARQSGSRPEEHGRAAAAAARQLPLQRGAQGPGLAFGTFNRGIPFEPLLGNKAGAVRRHQVQLDRHHQRRESASASPGTRPASERDSRCWSASSWSAQSGIGADTYQFPKIANGVLGTKFKVVTGYPGGNDIDLAMERQEVQGRCGWSWTSVKATRSTGCRKRSSTSLFQMGLAKHPELPDTPLIMDLAKTDEERDDLQADLRTAGHGLAVCGPTRRAEGPRRCAAHGLHGRRCTDKDFLADAAKAKFEIRSVSGMQIQQLVQDIYSTPPGGRPEDQWNCCNRRLNAILSRAMQSSSFGRSRQPDRDRMPIRDEYRRRHRQHAADQASSGHRRRPAAPSWARPNS